MSSSSIVYVQKTYWIGIPNSNDLRSEVQVTLLKTSSWTSPEQEDPLSPQLSPERSDVRRKGHTSHLGSPKTFHQPSRDNPFRHILTIDSTQDDMESLGQWLIKKRQLVW